MYGHNDLCDGAIRVLFSLFVHSIWRLPGARALSYQCLLVVPWRAPSFCSTAPRAAPTHTSIRRRALIGSPLSCSTLNPLGWAGETTRVACASTPVLRNVRFTFYLTISKMSSLLAHVGGVVGGRGSQDYQRGFHDKP